MKSWMGEIVEASSRDFIAQSYLHGQAPVFGGLVRTTLADGCTIFGVVYDVRTTGVDPGSRPVVRGANGLRDQAIYDANPDLAQVLRTDVSALTLGFRSDGVMHHVLPPLPPSLHWSVCECTEAECRDFTVRTSYLRTLVDAMMIPADEVIGAHLRQASDASIPGDDFIMRAGRELAELLRMDYPRLRGIIDRARPRY
jgi:hypothetical protein